MSQRSYPRSDHFDGTRFFNPGSTTDHGFSDILRWRRNRQPVAWPAAARNDVFPPPPAGVGAGEFAFTFIGHVTYLIQAAGLTILNDPVFSDRAGPFGLLGPKRVRPPGLRLDDLPRINAVLLSHNHFDHMDVASLRALHARSNPVIITGLGNARFLHPLGIGPIVELDWWERHDLGPETSVTYVPAQHWSRRGLFDRRRALWGGHVLEAPAGRIYVAGDSGYFDGFRAIGDRLGPPDVAILPIGAYEPRWFMHESHMDPAEAVQAHIDLGASLSLAAHWGTFPLSDEGMDDPVRELAAARSERGIDAEAFRAPSPGETVLVRPARRV